MLSKFTKGVLSENPVFRLCLGLCPVLGVTSEAGNAFIMGLLTALVLFFSNVTVYLIKGLIPDSVRLPAFLIIIATYVSVADMAMSTFAPLAYHALGVFVPLIVVNCLILSRAEAAASSHESFKPVLADALGMGVGFILSITLVGVIRQFLGGYFSLFVMPSGAFLILGMLFALFLFVSSRVENKV